MEEGFELPVTFNGKDLQFPSKLVQFGYTYRVEVSVDGTILFFERDEERNWRAIIDTGKIDSTINVGLLNAIVESLDNL